MSTLTHLMEALIIGIAIAAPVGPIGVLCIRKTLEIGILGAIAVGLGAAVADAAYGLIAALGLSFITNLFLSQVAIIKLGGGVFLLYLAYKDASNQTTTKAASTKSKSGLQLACEVLFLTLANPMTILSFIGIFASIASGPTSNTESVLMVLGIFLGSMSWWLILGGFISSIRHKLSELWMSRIKYLSALIIAGFGVYAIVGVF